MTLRILTMLKRQKRHVSFHTPGHKRAGADITELDYSDNLMNPVGVLKIAQEEIAQILGAERSFILTDGSTCGVFAMIYALKAAGVKTLAFPAYSHASVKNACSALGVAQVEFCARRIKGIPAQPTAEEIERALESADALLLTSPDYYGFLPPLQAAQTLCAGAGKPLVIDGAHGAHLHFTSAYAGLYADMWVDGVHKSLPALTQGAVVSAKNEWGERLSKGVRAFRTSSPSYPIMASVEYAVKYPRNEAIERAAEECKQKLFALKNDDWSKILIAFGGECDTAQAFLQKHGVYPEFNDGNYLMFYLSPCTKKGHLKKLVRLVQKLPRGSVEEETENTNEGGQSVTWVPLNEAEGRVCAQECGLFPPCVPLVLRGQRVSGSAVEKLSRGNTFGLKEGKICVYAEE